MPNIAVIIPYFQRSPKILSRALTSIAAQKVPDGWSVDVIVVDDSSPVPAADEIRDVNIKEPIRLTVIRQEAAGAAAARNRGLEAASPATEIIAFLDSDDIWPTDHLVRAVAAINDGFDIYFKDNRRVGYHASHLDESAPETKRAILATKQRTGTVEIPPDMAVGLFIKEFPAQTSTVVYRQNIAPSLRFNMTLKHTSEDLVFFTTLGGAASRIGFDLDSVVECGEGINMFFGNFGWDSPKCLPIRVDQVLARRIIGRVVPLPNYARQVLHLELVSARRDLAFHVIRNLLKSPARVSKEVARLAYLDRGAALALPFDMAREVLWRVFRLGGKPKEAPS